MMQIIKRAKDTAPTQAFQPRVHGMAAPYLACTAVLCNYEITDNLLM